jgi:phosphoribosylamine--glycine ligase
MRVLVVGSGGREHALVWKLLQSPRIDALFCAPGNGGIHKLASCVDIEPTDVEGLVGLAKRERIDLAVIGPESALAVGAADAFDRAGVRVFGPSRAGAQVETSKVFAKVLMEKYGVPTASFKTFEEYGAASDYLRRLVPPYVVKADGICAGKGAYVIKDPGEGEAALRELLVDKVHGEAGKKVIIEGFLPGVETSYLAFTDGSALLPMLPSQDHKALLDNDEGPNTGGMGAYAPVPFVDKELEGQIDKTIMKVVVEGLRKEGIVYRGVLYGGLMLDGRKPYVLEFNARFGDPETQPLLFKMESDLLPILCACAEGALADAGPISWKQGVALCVVLASRGYPAKPEKGKVIRGLEALEGRDDVFVFHAGTQLSGGQYYTAGGRVLGVTVLGETYGDAVDKAYDAISLVEFEGMHFRKDIGRKAFAPRSGAKP